MIALVLGGARSGKSELGERLAAGLDQPVTYVATGVAVPGSAGDAGGDQDWARRLAAHRARRPAGWTTVEVPAGADLAPLLAGLDGTALVDSLGTWLAGREGLSADGEALCAALAGRRGDTIVISDEVGLGVHPFSEAGRRFRDSLGGLNRQVADRADRVLLVVAGRALTLEPSPGEAPLAQAGDVAPVVQAGAGAPAVQPGPAGR